MATKKLTPRGQARKPANIKLQPQKPKGPSMVERAKKFLGHAINYVWVIPALLANLSGSQVLFMTVGNAFSVVGGAFFIDASAKKAIGIVRRAIILAAALICVGYNLYNALSNSSHFSAEHVDARRGEIDKKLQTEGLLKSIDTQIAALQAQRKPLADKAGEDTPETIRKAIDGKHYDALWRRTKECTNATADESRKFCDSITKLEGAIPAAEARGKIDDKLDPLQTQASNLRTKLAEMAPPAAADELGQAVGNLASIAGYEMSEKSASSARTVKDTWMALVWEILAAIGPLATAAMRGTHETAQPMRAEKKAGRKTVSKPQDGTKNEQDDQDGENSAQNTAQETGLQTVLPVTVCTFRDERLDPSTGSRISGADMYVAYVKFCDERGADAISQTAFGNAMRDEANIQKRKIGGTLYYLDWGFRRGNLRVVK